VTVGERAVRIPDDRLVDVEARVGEIELRFLNLDGEPVKGLRVELRAGGYAHSTESDDKGMVRIARIPYSDLKGVGAYSLVINMGKLVIYEGSLEVSEPRVSKNMTLPLASMRLTVVNLEGEPVPKITVKLSSGGYSTEGRSDSGTLAFKNLPLSKVSGVGIYKINVSMRVGRGDMPIYYEERSIDRSANISLIADLARLRVRVIDEDGEPVKGVVVSLSNRLMANFTSSQTDKNGEVVFENVPLSRGMVSAGAYVIQAIRAGRIIGELRTEFEKPGTILDVVVMRGEQRLKLLDYHGRPLAGYLVRLVDEIGGESLNASTNDLGEAVFKIFHGPYIMEVYSNGRRIRSSSIQLAGGFLEIKLNEVNFPLSIKVVDVMGRPISSGHIEVSAEGRTLISKELSGEPVNLDLPYPLELRCDIYSDDGRLLHRELLHVYGPRELVVELRGYIFLGGIMELEAVAAAVVLAIVAACALKKANNMEIPRNYEINLTQSGRMVGDKPDWTLSRNPTEVCNPLCRYFRCGRKDLDFKRNPPWCGWVNSPCVGYRCNYALCIQKKLLPDGRCALFVKRKTEEEEKPEMLESGLRIGAADRVRKKLDKFGI